MKSILVSVLVTFALVGCKGANDEQQNASAQGVGDELVVSAIELKGMRDFLYLVGKNATEQKVPYYTVLTKEISTGVKDGALVAGPGPNGQPSSIRLGKLLTLSDSNLDAKLSALVAEDVLKSAKKNMSQLKSAAAGSQVAEKEIESAVNELMVQAPRIISDLSKSGVSLDEAKLIWFDIVLETVEKKSVRLYGKLDTELAKTPFSKEAAARRLPKNKVVNTYYEVMIDPVINGHNLDDIGFFSISHAMNAVEHGAGEKAIEKLVTTFSLNKSKVDSVETLKANFKFARELPNQLKQKISKSPQVASLLRGSKREKDIIAETFFWNRMLELPSDVTLQNFTGYIVRMPKQISGSKYQLGEPVRMTFQELVDAFKKDPTLYKKIQSAALHS